MLKETVDANPDVDFFIFATAGGEEDGAGVMMTDQVRNFLAQEDCVFSYGLDQDANNFYFTRSAFDHNDIWMPYTLYNALPIIFGGELKKEVGAAAVAEEAAAANDDETAFLLTWEAFDEDQVLEGFVEDGVVTVTYDETGFMTGDAQIIWDDAVASEEPWAPIE